MRTYFITIFFLLIFSCASGTIENEKPRIIVTSDGEIDDECSMVRFLLYTNEWDVEGIITSSSQYHWHGHNWAGDDWADPYLNAYAEVYPNLIKHDEDYPDPDYLKSITFLGNVETEGEMDLITAGSQHIVKVLLDESDDRPIWLQAWGGPNTIARALKTIQEEHPDKMEYVAKKIRFFFIWEQDSTYQSYIRPNWGKFNIPTIISDQFEAIAYRWKTSQPDEMHPYFQSDWMRDNILENHGPLTSLYKAHNGDKDDFQKGDFRSEGDSPAFMHQIPTGLRNLESPDWGGWAGRYVLVRENTWLDPVPISEYEYPEGRWYGSNSWGRRSSKKGGTVKNSSEHKQYFKPIWRWSDDFQKDFAARADWCVKSFEDANHPPSVKLANEPDMVAKPGSKIKLSAKGTTDPDGDELKFLWWQYEEADTYNGRVEVSASGQYASLIVPYNAKKGSTIHVICEVTDDGLPSLTRYSRTVITID
ncbi:MAG: DUF1593 domain-containing protein [Bacteroidota bacterium]